jgi:hypothetical protein
MATWRHLTDEYDPRHNTHVDNFGRYMDLYICFFAACVINSNSVCRFTTSMTRFAVCDFVTRGFAQGRIYHESVDAS